MQKAKVDVLVCTFAYGGNGGVSSIIPELGLWTSRTLLKMKQDERIGRIQPEILSDTPITMTRNRAVKMAKDQGYDMILMLDSDNEPDGYLGADHKAKPFWETAFDFAYERLVKDIPTVIAAPYCGPPPHPVSKDGYWHGGEVPYLFEWMDNESDDPSPSRKLEMLTRNEAARLGGIYPVAALPTGCCLFTTSTFAYPPPPRLGYFHYEMNEDASEKHSTEDVVATRDISLYWRIGKGVDVIFAACDSWALHYKPKRVGKPRVTPVEAMAKHFRESLADPVSARETKLCVDFTHGLPLPMRGNVLHDEPEGEPPVLEQPIPTSYVPVAEAATWIDEQDPDPDYGVVTVANDQEHKGNGHPLVHRMIGGKKIATLGSEVSEASLDAIQALTAWAAKAGPIEAAVAHAGSGQAAAAILAEMPEGSHLYALDTPLTYQFSQEPSQAFSKSFQPELESGRVMADLSGRKFPWPEGQQHLDFVFIERSVTVAKCERWLDHVRSGGVLAGLGYEDAGLAKHLDSLAATRNLKKKTMGDVWALVK